MLYIQIIGGVEHGAVACDNNCQGDKHHGFFDIVFTFIHPIDDAKAKD